MMITLEREVVLQFERVFHQPLPFHRLLGLHTEHVLTLGQEADQIGRRAQ